MPKKDITLHIEGHPGHRGNALAHALVDKLQKLLSALGQAERAFIDKRARQTDYEIVDAGKVNPTHITLHPIPRRMNYDPMPAFNWTFEQIEHVALGGEVDDRIDATFARTLAEIAKKNHEDDYSNLWITVDEEKIVLDETFRIRSEVIANRKTEEERPPQWFVGISHGSVVGDLREVADVDGERQFVIIPPVGAQRINCTFPESKREKMRQFLFRTVRVIGKLHYKQDSPFPVQVDMDDIELATPFVEAPHLLDLRGLFKGLERSTDDPETILNGL